MSDPRCRIEHRKDVLVQFLKDNRYPIEWTEEMFSDALAVKVFDDVGTIGYFWGQWLDTGCLGIHVCVDQDRYRDWYRSDILHQLKQIGFWLGADELFTSIRDDVPKARKVRLMLRRVGFTADPGRFGEDHGYTCNLWTE